MNNVCTHCGDEFPMPRAEIGYRLCLPCGDEVARKKVFTVAPMHKSNYMMFTDMNDLKGINNKGGLIK